MTGNTVKAVVGIPTGQLVPRRREIDGDGITGGKTMGKGLVEQVIEIPRIT